MSIMLPSSSSSLMSLSKVRGNLERLFDKNLTDLVRGIRNNKDDEAKYIATCLEEIRQELRHPNTATKTNAVSKLTYLQMIGYDISWAGFNVIEVMSSTRFTEKRIGYLAASQCFHEETDVLMLTTNLIRKDLNSSNQYESGAALSALACFVSPDLARDLSNDILTLLSSTKPYLRKKAVLILYKVFLRYPEALRAAFPRLREKLEDPDPGVQSAAVNVVCELARKNPKNYLSLAPTFFKLMTSSTNNWMLIKIIKLFGALTPLEPRLGRKLIEPLTNLIHSTSAMSLLYECVNTVIAVLISISSEMPSEAGGNAAVQLCVQKLRVLIEDSDQNLKYLGLLAMSKILKTNPKSVQGHKDLIMQCLDDSDESIRLRALDLLYGMVTRKNLMEIVRRLMGHMEKAEGTAYRDELMEKIVQICSQNDYQYVTNFEWYVSVLLELTRMERSGSGSKHGALIAAQMMDVAIRVDSIRPFAVKQMALLVENGHVLLRGGGGGAATTSTVGTSDALTEVLYAAAWICGEFPQHLADARATLLAMFRGKTASTLPTHIQAVYVQNALKLFAFIAASSESQSDLVELARQLETHLSEFVVSADLEVQERASTGLQLIKYVIKLSEGSADFSAGALSLFFAGELNPVGPKAQKKVPLPEGLDLDAWINEPLPDTESESSDEEDVAAHAFVRSPSDNTRSSDKSHKGHQEPTEDELRMSREQRLLQQSLNPNYLKDPKSSSNASSSLSSPRSKSLVGMEDIPVQQVDAAALPLFIPGLASTDQYLNMSRDSSDEDADGKSKKKRSKKKKKKERSENQPDEPEEPVVSAVVRKRLEMPEGAAESDDDADANRLPADDPHRALSSINLDDLEYRAPYRASETDAAAGMGVADGGSAHVPRNLFGASDGADKSHKKKKKKEKEKEPEERRARKDSEKKKKKKKEKEKDKENGDKNKKDKKEKKHKKHKSEKAEADGIDLWLDGGHA